MQLEEEGDEPLPAGADCVQPVRPTHCHPRPLGHLLRPWWWQLLHRILPGDSHIFTVDFTPPWQAHLQWPLTNSFCVTSVYIIISMTVNRYIALYKPTEFQRIHTLKNAWLCICIFFISSVFLHVPLCFENKMIFNGFCLNPSNTSSSSLSISINETGVECGWQSLENVDIVDTFGFKAYLVLSQILFRLGPILLLAILTTLIIHKFLKIVKKRVSVKELGSGAGRLPSVSSTSQHSPAPPLPPNPESSSSPRWTMQGKWQKISNGLAFIHESEIPHFCFKIPAIQRFH